MMDQRLFGRTNHASSRALLGGAALGKIAQDEADAAIDLALGYGVNHIDTAPSYGESERRIGSWIRRHGKTFFLATKTGERTAVKAREEIQRSLERLGVAQIDLLQLHNLVEPQEWEIALGPGGALEAGVAARDEGLVRFIGITGHGVTAPSMHTRALARFDFDAVLAPYSYLMAQNARYLADFDALVQLCQSRRVAVQTIKSIVRAPWGDRERTRATWYEPLEDQNDIDLAVHWVLSNPNVFLNTVGDVNILPKVLLAASRFQASPASDAMRAQLTQLEMSPLFT